MQKSKYKIKKNIDLNILLEKYGFEWGEDYEYELYHIRDLNDCYLIYDITLDDLAESVLTYILYNDYLKRKEQN